MARRALRESMTLASDCLRSQQRRDGSWPSPSDTGPASTVQTAACLDYVGALTSAEARSVARWLARQAEPGGGFVSSPSAPEGDLGTTAVTAAFLRRYGDAPGVVEQADAFVAAHGGVERLRANFWKGDTSIVLLAMLGTFPVDELPDVTLAPLTIPGAERWLMRHVHGGIVMTIYAVRLIVLGLRGEGGWLAERERARGVYWLDAFQNRFDGPRSGSWNAWAPVTAFHVAALRAAGLPLQDPRIASALRWLREESMEEGGDLCWRAFSTPLWATVFTTQALLAAGEPVDATCIATAGAWILSAQCRSPQSPHNHVVGDGPLVGGFAFRPDNPVLPDSDDSGAALGALGALAAANPRTELARGIADCVAWLRGMQNPDGGFSSYVCGLPGKGRGPLFADPSGPLSADVRSLVRLLRGAPRELGDPSTEDVTGRVLHGFGLVGLRVGDPSVDRALAFLQAQQLEDGAFWGRWLVNYLAGTAYALRGALAVGARGAWIERALDFLVARQRDDGAWGESPQSYADPSLRGRGPACAAATGRVLCALIEGGRSEGAPVRRGIDWLLSQQREDGSWDGSRHLGVIYPPDRFYRHDAAGTYYPLWAMSLFTKATVAG